jgi:hypothetical protein
MERLSFKSASFHRHQVYNFPIAAPAENEDPSSSASSNQHGCQDLSYALPASATQLYLPLTLLQDRNVWTNLVSKSPVSLRYRASPEEKFLAIVRSEEQHPFSVASLGENLGNPISLIFFQLYVTLTILQHPNHPLPLVD